MTGSKFQLLVFYLRGFVQVFLLIALVSMLLLWTLQIIAFGYGESYPWADILVQIFLSLSFLVFFPGQSLWRFELKDSQGKSHVIVGEPV